ncbi:MAG TPA: hypothetical protein VHQ02_04695 [Usitatibacter sp.]|jgi:hypothetical protein|nr:hypothetical protein [Usitatibacter sp.]
MHTQARKPLAAAFAAVLLAAAALCAPRAHAACGEHRDFLTHADPLLASVRPADCATLFAEAPQFTWPQQDGARAYTVALTFPDGHTESRTTSGNWLAWDRSVPPGEYSWRVTTEGRAGRRSEARTFHVDESTRTAQAAGAAKRPRADAAAAARPAATAGAVFQFVPSETWIPATGASGAPHKARTGGLFGGFTE